MLQADAHALRAKRLLLAGTEDVALTEAAVGLAMLDEKVPPDASFGPRVWDVLMASTLMDLGLVLMELGVYEVGDQVMRRAHRHIRNGAGPHDISVHLITRCRMQLGWGLRLERIGEDDQAAERFARAAAMAGDVEAPFRESLFPRRADLPAADQIAVVGAAHALAAPGTRARRAAVRAAGDRRAPRGDLRGRRARPLPRARRARRTRPSRCSPACRSGWATPSPSRRCCCA